MKYICTIFAFICIFAINMQSALAKVPEGQEQYITHLNKIIQEFDDAETDEEKYKIVKRPYNYKELWETNANDDRTLNALILAIVQAKADIVKKFLEVIPDVNADELAGIGYRQIYLPVSFALDPSYYGEITAIKEKDRGYLLEKRLEIIDLLGKKGANFNVLIITGNHNYPPLAAGDQRGKDENIVFKFEMRARAILWGADPEYFLSLCNNAYLEQNRIKKEFYNEVYRQYLDAHENQLDINPVDSVCEKLREIHAATLARLQEIVI